MHFCRFNTRLGLFVLLAAWSFSAVSIHMTADAHAAASTSIELSNMVVPLRYALSFEIDPNQDAFSGMTQIEVNIRKPTKELSLHGHNLIVKSVQWSSDGTQKKQACTWQETDTFGSAKVRCPDAMAQGPGTLSIRFTAHFDKELAGFYRVKVKDAWYGFTQFEPYSARRAFPSFDEPRFKTPFDITLTVPKDMTAVSNGQTVKVSLDRDGLRKRVEFRTTEPLPTYLVAWAVGRFDIAEVQIPPSALRKAPLTLRAIATLGHGSELTYALSETPKILNALEAYAAIAYPYPKLDIVAVPDFAAGAMENAGLITFRDYFLLLNKERMSESQRRMFILVMTHELAHQWFGNLVTMKWWDDLWLNEAFATWMEAKISGALYPDLHRELEIMNGTHAAMYSDSLSSARRIREPILQYDQILNAFDGITYQKGAAILHMFEQWVGASAFQQGVRNYLEIYQLKNASTHDFLSEISKAAKQDIEPSFRTFLDQPGLPILSLSMRCSREAPIQGNRDTPSSTHATLTLRQKRFVPYDTTPNGAFMRWQIPFCARYEEQEQCAILNESTSTLALRTACPAWILPNRNGAGYYRWSMAKPLWNALFTKGWAKANPEERFAIADSVIATYETGELSAEVFFSNIKRISEDEARPVAQSPIGTLAFLSEYVVDAQSREAFERWASSLYAPVVKRFGGFTKRRVRNGEDALLQASALEFLALVARNPGVRKEASRIAPTWLDEIGAAAPTSRVPELTGTVLLVGSQTLGAPYHKKLWSKLDTLEDGIARNDILTALGAADDPTLTESLLTQSLTAKLRQNERLIVLQEQMRHHRTRKIAWSWFKSHIHDLTNTLPLNDQGELPWLGKPFCDETHRRDIEDFFAQRIKNMPGGTHELTAALEALDQCAKKAARLAKDAREFLRRAAPEHS